MTVAPIPGKIQSPALLKAVYTELLRRDRSGTPLVELAPTTIVGPDVSVLRAFDQEYFVVDTHRRVLRRDHADKAIIVRDEFSDQNRFTGKSHDPSIPAWGGLYCSLQQQATVNEAAYYFEKGRAKKAADTGKSAPTPVPRSVVMHSKCVLKINLLGPFIAVDLSAHNSYARPFVESVGRTANVNRALSISKGKRSLWDAMFDSDDYSVARGFGLALAAHGYRSLVVQTARGSERSRFERGDNIIFFGRQGQRIGNLLPVEAYLFPIIGGGLDSPDFLPGMTYPTQIVVYPVGL